MTQGYLCQEEDQARMVPERFGPSQGLLPGKPARLPPFPGLLDISMSPLRVPTSHAGMGETLEQSWVTCMPCYSTAALINPLGSHVA